MNGRKQSVARECELLLEGASAQRRCHRRYVVEPVEGDGRFGLLVRMGCDVDDGGLGQAAVGSDAVHGCVTDILADAFVAAVVVPDREEEAAAGDPESLKPLKLGISVQKLTRELAERLKLDGTEGILVTEVEAGSAADRAGINRGDVIVEVNRRAVSNLKDFWAAIRKAGKGDSLLLLVKRGQASLFIVVKPED